MKPLSGWSRRARLTLIALGWAGAPGVSACAISFGGYELDQSDGGVGGGSSSVTTAGGGGNGGNGPGGSVGTAGSAGSQGGNAGSGQGGSGGGAGRGGNGGSGTGGNGGNATGGAGGSSGAAGRDGGATGGVAGGGGAGGSAGAAGRGGASGAGGFPADAGDAATDGGGGRGCPLLPGPQLIELPLPSGAPGAPGTYCVDQTEVTNKQYADFLATNPGTGSQPGICSWNTDFTPTTMANPDNCPNVSLVYDPVAKPSFPVACIDWCDANAYCASVGKHLCRSFAGTDLPTNKTADATSDEWYAACSVAGADKFAYGNTYQATYCNMDLFGSSSSIMVGTAPACHGPSLPYSYIYDMNGNVAEWQGACTGAAGAADTCAARGGSWLSSNSPDPTRAGDCVAAPPSARSRRSAQIGFRCCYDRK